MLSSTAKVRVGAKGAVARARRPTLRRAGVRAAKPSAKLGWRIYKPLKNGTFTGGILKHKLALVKAGLAGLFAYHELKLAIQDARASPKLQKLVAPITALGDKLKSIGDDAKSGNFDPSTIASANSDVTSLSGLAKQAGVSISPQEPSASALASGG